MEKRPHKQAKKLKDKRIIIYRKSSVKDADGYTVTGYKPIHPAQLWAYIRQLSGNELFAAQAVNASEEVLFTVNWNADLVQQSATVLMIRQRERWYQVTRVDTFEGYKNDIKLYAKSASAPKPSEIMPYQ